MTRDRLKRLFWTWFTFWEGALIAYFFGLWWAAGWCAVWLVFAFGYSLAKSQKFTAWISDT